MSELVPYATGPRRSSVEALEEFTTAREEAERVRCPQCSAEPGAHCRNEITGEALKRFPAHNPRTKLAVGAAQKKQETR